MIYQDSMGQLGSCAQFFSSTWCLLGSSLLLDNLDGAGRSKPPSLMFAGPAGVAGMAGADWASLSRGLHRLVVQLGLFYISEGSPEIKKESCKVSSGQDLEVEKLYFCYISLVKASDRTSRDPKGREIVFISFWEVSGMPVERWKEFLAIILQITYHKR